LSDIHETAKINFITSRAMGITCSFYYIRCPRGDEISYCCSVYVTQRWPYTLL